MGTMSDEKESRFNELLRRIESGRTMMSVCSDADMPSRSTVGLRCKTDANFALRYKNACEQGKLIQADLLSQQIKKLDAQGLSRYAIASELHIAPKTVNKVLGMDYSPLPGFPKKDKFQTEEEIKAYFANDELQCLLCGRYYRGLFQHLKKGHCVELEEYRVMYGIPLSYGLAGEDTIQIMTENSISRYHNDERIRKSLKLGGATNMGKEQTATSMLCLLY